MSSDELMLFSEFVISVFVDFIKLSIGFCKGLSIRVDCRIYIVFSGS